MIERNFICSQYRYGTVWLSSVSVVSSWYLQHGQQRLMTTIKLMHASCSANSQSQIFAEQLFHIRGGVNKKGEKYSLLPYLGGSLRVMKFFH